jgi:two-component system, response regulator / RNA-binding antiterminator
MLRPELKILIVDDSAERTRLIEEGLRDAGQTAVTHAPFHGLVRVIEDLSPDIIVMDLGNPNRDFLEHMFSLSKAIQKPVAMFVDQSSEQAMLDAVEAGVSAYVVDGLRRDRVKPILDLAIARFRAFERIKQERDEARAALDARTTIDRAKRILMRSRSLSEEEAYALLRASAMKQSRSMADIATALIIANELHGGDAS